MDLHISFIYLFGLILVLFKSIQSKEFCESYAENNYKIDYEFRKINGREMGSDSHLFIDSHYWHLEFIHNAEDQQKALVLSPTDSKQSKHWFGNQYSMAFCLWQPIERYCAIGLINKNKTLIDFRKRVGHYGREHKIKGYNRLNETNIVFNRFNPTIAFVPNREEYNRKLVLFVEQKPKDSQRFQIITKLYEFDDNFHGTYAQNISLIESIEPTAIRSLDPELQLMAITAQQSYVRRDNETELKFQFGLIILFKFQKLIKYCWTHDKQLSHSCKKENLRVLIDCSEYGDKQIVESQESVDNSSQNSGLLLTAIPIIIFVSIFIIAITYCRFKSKNIKTDPEMDLIVVNEVDIQLNTGYATNADKY